MELTSLSSIPQNLISCIADYNKERPGEKKGERLNDIRALVSQFLEESKSIADVQTLGKELKAVRWYEDDLSIRSQILGKIEAYLPAAAATAPQLIGNIYVLIANETDRETIANLLRSNKELKESLTQPKALADFLTKFSHELSPQTRLALALRCGPSLTHLDLSEFKSFNDVMLQQLRQNCTNLQSLNLSGTSIQTLNYLPKSLKMLDLRNCRALPPEAFEKLTEDSFPNLEKLNLTWTKIKRVDHLSKNLKELDLSLCIDLPPEAFEKLTTEAFPHLEKLNLQGTTIIRIEYLSKSLKELNLSNCGNIPGVELMKKLTADSFPQLEKLGLMTTSISSLNHLPKSLKLLDISHCALLQPEAFEKLTQETFPNLEELDVEGTNIKRVDHLPESLRELDLSHCDDLTAETFEQLTNDSFPNLKKLNLLAISIPRNLLPKRLQAVSVEENIAKCIII